MYGQTWFAGQYFIPDGNGIEREAPYLSASAWISGSIAPGIQVNSFGFSAGIVFESVPEPRAWGLVVMGFGGSSRLLEV